MIAALLQLVDKLRQAVRCSGVSRKTSPSSTQITRFGKHQRVRAAPVRCEEEVVGTLHPRLGSVGGAHLMWRPRVSSSSSRSSLKSQLSGDMATSAVASRNFTAARRLLYWSTQVLPPCSAASAASTPPCTVLGCQLCNRSGTAVLQVGRENARMHSIMQGQRMSWEPEREVVCSQERH